MEEIKISNEKRTKCEIWSRSVGYLRPVEQWHSGKQAEFEDRKTFDQQTKSQSDLAK